MDTDNTNPIDEKKQQKIAEIIDRNLGLSDLIDALATAENTVVNYKAEYDRLNTAIWSAQNNFRSFKEEVIRVLMEADLGDYTRDSIFEDLELEKPSVNWRISFDIEIEYGTDVDDIATDVESYIGRMNGIVSVDYNDSEEL
jgi:hypothetical protein